MLKKKWSNNNEHEEVSKRERFEYYNIQAAGNQTHMWTNDFFLDSHLVKYSTDQR